MAGGRTDRSVEKVDLSFVVSSSLEFGGPSGAGMEMSGRFGGLETARDLSGRSAEAGWAL